MRDRKENWRLRWERQRRGWSQDDVVDHLQHIAAVRGSPEPGVERNTISRWERGISRPTPRYIQLLSAAFELPPENLGLVSPPPAPSNGLPDDDLVARLQPDVDRRTFLRHAAGVAGLAVARGNLAGLPLDGEPWERLMHALSHPSSSDSTLVSDMETLTSGIHDLEAQMPARQVFAQLSLHLDRLANLLHGSTDETLRRRLIGTAGDTAVLGAWVAWDLGDRPGAFRLYETAITAAREGNDPALRACILAYASYGASADGDSRRARDLLELAGRSLEGTGHPAARAWIRCRQAEETAALGDRPSALRLLESGLTGYEDAHPDRERVWTRFLDSTRMGGFAISTYARVGDTAAALGAAERVLAGLKPDEAKKRALVLAPLAEAYLQRGDLEVGLEVANLALDAAHLSETTWGFQNLVRLRPLLGGSTSPDVRSLDQRLAALSQPPPPSQNLAPPLGGL